MKQFKIDRINELSRKSKIEELTPAEKAEQKALRDEYVGLIRKNFTGTLNSITLVDEEGNKTPLKDKKKKV